MRASKGFRFTDLLSPDFYKRRPGRPVCRPGTTYCPGPKSWALTILRPLRPRRDVALATAARRQTAERERNQALLEGYRVAKSHGMTMRAFAKQWFRECYGCEATPDEVRTVERQIARLLKK